MSIVNKLLTYGIVTGLLLTPYIAHAAEPQTGKKDIDSHIIGRNAAAANKVRCKKIQMTGTHFPKRVCKKQSEWDAMRQRALELVKNRDRTVQEQNRNQRY
jgi:hypothetical protein